LATTTGVSDLLGGSRNWTGGGKETFRVLSVDDDDDVASFESTIIGDVDELVELVIRDWTRFGAHKLSDIFFSGARPKVVQK
jgi:hypothetical protein